MNGDLVAFDGSGDVNVDFSHLISSKLLIQAGSGGGKSRALRYLVEQASPQCQVFVIDPEGEFASLREKFPFILAGDLDEGADIPATPETASLTCRNLMKLGASAVLDLFHLQTDKRREFVSQFIGALMETPKSEWRPLVVAIDEAHIFCPEGSAVDSSQAIMSLCSLGRKRGFCAVLATQRLSKLHKDAAADLHNKMIGLTTMDVDVKRAADDLGFDKNRSRELKHLRPGQFFAFGPAVSKEVVLVTTGAVKTTHPVAGQVIRQAPPAPGELQAAIREMVAAQLEISKAAQAEQEKVSAGDSDGRVKAAEDEAARLRATVRHMEARVSAQVDALFAAADAIVDAAKLLRDTISPATTVVGWDAETKTLVLESSTGDMGEARPATEGEAAHVKAPREPGPAPAATTPKGISGPGQRILDTLASFAALGMAEVDRSVVAMFADQSPKSSAYSNNLGSLRSAGLVSYPAGGKVALTKEGADQADGINAPPTLATYQQTWMSKVSGPQRRILEELITVYPHDKPKEWIAEATGQSLKSSAFSNNLGFLRNSLGLIEYTKPGHVAATKRLFPEGLK